MSAPIRFIGLALFAWVGVRAASLGLLPGVTDLVPEASATPLPPQAQQLVSTPVAPEAYAPSEAYASAPAGWAPYAYAPRMPAPTIVLPAGWGRPATYAPPPPANAWDQVVAPPVDYERYAELDPLPFAAPPLPPAGRAAVSPAAAPPSPRLDRLQLATWALLRNGLGNAGLAQGGTLGGSQVGARLSYKFTPQLAASLRFSSSAGGVRGAEAAAGVRWQPLRNVPVALNVERREGLGRFGGRSAFAAFAEAGLYQQPVALGFNLDAYAQGGMVGIRRRDWFADGSVAVTRPIWGSLSGGFGLWAGGQSDGFKGSLYRVDAGPRLSYSVRRNVRLHADYRQRLAGDALPRSGPALTIAGDF